MQSSLTYTAKQIIGQRIKQLRKKQNLTQQQLGDLVGIDRQYMCRIENGKINMTLNKLDKIIEALNCTPSEFFNLKQ